MATNAEQTIRIPLKQEAPITDPLHLVNKKYVDDAVLGLRWDPVKAASTTALACANPVVDALTLDGDAVGTLPAFDGVTLALNDRLLLKNQADKTQNGIFVVKDLGSASTKWKLKRADDADESGDFRPAKNVYVLPGGTVNGGLTFEQATASTITVGATVLEFKLVQENEYVRCVSVRLTGDDVTTEWTVNHKLDTEDVQVGFRNATTQQGEILGWELAAAQRANSIVVRCDPALPTGTVIIATVQG